AIQRLMNAMRQAHADGWFIVFDTLTLADDRLEAFYDNPNALRDYFRDIGRMVLAAEGPMFQTFISRHNSNFFSDKLVLTSVTPASSAPVLQTPKATSSTLYFDSLTVNAG